MAEVWERQTGESSKAYAAFCIYRDLGAERSIERVRREFAERGRKISAKFLGRWSSKYDWVERARAYDDYLDRIRREAKEKEILEITERYGKVAVFLLQMVMRRLREMNPSELTPRDMASWLDITLKIERFRMIGPNDIIVNRMSDNKLFPIRLSFGDTGE